VVIVILEYDFNFFYKYGRSHLMTNALNILPNQAQPIGVPDQTIDVHVFIL